MTNIAQKNMHKNIFTKIFIFAAFGLIIMSGCQNYTGSEVVLYYPDSIPQIKVYYKKVKGKEYVAKQNIFYSDGQLNVCGYYDLSHNKTGKWTTYFADGKIQRIEHYKKGLKNGKYIEFYPSGKKMYSAYYKNGLPDGKWIIYDNNGKIMSKKTYKDGNLLD